VIPTQSEKTSVITKSEFITKINFSINLDSSFYSTTIFFIGDGSSHYENEACIT